MSDRQFSLSQRELRRKPGKGLPRRHWPLLLLFVALMFVIVLIWLFRAFSLPSPDLAETRIVEIKPGQGLKSITRLLADEQIIRRPWMFEWWVRFKHLDKRLRVGTYELAVGESIPVVLQKLINGQTVLVGITILEGMTLPQIAGALAARLPDIDTARFMRLATDSAFIAGQNTFPGAATLEGFLFPDTYRWEEHVSDTAVIRTMLGNFKQVFLEEYARSARRPALSLYELVILASIVEREAQRAEERPIIAAVFYNRLHKRIYLESCATINYFLDPQDRKRVLTFQDLKTPSPYNTYLHLGLPPGPIGSPGRASIRAAMNPADTDVLYFVAKGDGSHYFSATLAEHVNAKRKYRANYSR
jgi:UPF0755 protein